MSDKPNSEHEIKLYINPKGQPICCSCNVEMEWLWDMLKCPKCGQVVNVEAYYLFLQSYGTPEIVYPV